jgi:hypothetical protein
MEFMIDFLEFIKKIKGIIKKSFATKFLKEN